MSLQACNGCGERKHGKYANTTVAWWNVANKRLAYRLKICTDCFLEHIEPVRLAVESDEFNCPYCHTDPGPDSDPTYLTLFVPNFGKLQIECNTCAADAVKLRSFAVEHGELLQDVVVGGQGPGPQQAPPTWDEWLKAGINARGFS